MAAGGDRSEAGPGAGAAARRPGRTRSRGHPASVVPVPCGCCLRERAARQVLGRDFLHSHLRADRCKLQPDKKHFDFHDIFFFFFFLVDCPHCSSLQINFHVEHRSPSFFLSFAFPCFCLSSNADLLSLHLHSPSFLPMSLHISAGAPQSL